MPFQKGMIPWNKGIPLTEECKQKLSESHKGYKPSEETKLKLRLARKGRTPMLGKHHSDETKKRMSLILMSNKRSLGKELSEEHKKKLSIIFKGENSPNFGSHRSEESKLKMSLAKIDKYNGENNPNWNGGITPENNKIRHSIEYKIWRAKVFKRDNWTCQKCNRKKGVKIRAHHIKPFSKYPELRYDINNGITYCKDCHENSGLHKELRKATA
jgi:hypothetical protein